MIALLADVHANLQALQACMRHASEHGARRFIFLGDLVGYGADPGAVLDIVAAQVAGHGAVAIQGNHDAAAVAGDDSLVPEARAAIEWTRSRLDARQSEFLRRLPLVAREGAVCFVHASADDPGAWTYVSDAQRAARSLAATDATWCFSGHVHEQQLYYQGAGRGLIGFRPDPGMPVPVGAHRRWLAIVGSAGQPRDGNPAAAYALFDPERARLVFQRVPYDHRAAAARIRAAGLPETLAAALEQGRW